VFNTNTKLNLHLYHASEDTAYKRLLIDNRIRDRSIIGIGLSVLLFKDPVLATDLLLIQGHTGG